MTISPNQSHQLISIQNPFEKYSVMKKKDNFKASLQECKTRREGSVPFPYSKKVFWVSFSVGMSIHER